MIIQSITSSTTHIPLVKTFKTALRKVDAIDYILVKVNTNTGQIGIGGAVPSVVITGETVGSILAAIDFISTAIAGMDLNDREEVLETLNACMVGNSSAKAAVDMAIYDLAGKMSGQPLYGLLGGKQRHIETDMTIGIDTLSKMEKDTRETLDKGFSILKIKVGHDPDEDIERLKTISAAAGPHIALRLDANQGWTAKQALKVSDAIARHNINVQLMEQPVKAHDIKGMAFVSGRTDLPVFADESLFSPVDAQRIIDAGAADGFNIKLMKCGGIYNALKISAIAETAGIPCMIGSMMETVVSITAAAHLACAKRIIKYFDLDAPLFCKSRPVPGGISYDGARIQLSSSPGLGFENV